MIIDHIYLIVLLSLAAASGARCSELDEDEAQSGEGKVDYTGYKVFRLIPHNEDQLEHLAGLYDKYEYNTNSMQFWTQPRGLNGTVDIMVSPDLQSKLLSQLNKIDIEPKVLIDDVGKVIKQTSGGPPPRMRHMMDNGTIIDDRYGESALSAESFFTRYHPYAIIEAKINELAKDPRVTVQVIGLSTERRKLYLVKVNTDGAANKPVIFIDAGHHAREWISHATGLFMLESLINPDMPHGRLSRIKLRRLRRRMQSNLDRYEFWFVPAVNPDGYDYSHSTDRLWRKTRSGSYICNGVDPNRNYPFHWGESGASPQKCDETYAGPRPLSEPETAAVARVLDQNKHRIKAYLSLHAYGQYLLAPYGYARKLPENYGELSRAARAWMGAVERYRGTRYQFGTSSILLYPAAGGSDDYAYGSANIKYSYTVELPDRGRRGFLLSPRDIIPVGQETVMGLHAMLGVIQRQGDRESDEGELASESPSGAIGGNDVFDEALGVE